MWKTNAGKINYLSYSDIVFWYSKQFTQVVKKLKFLQIAMKGQGTNSL